MGIMDRLKGTAAKAKQQASRQAGNVTVKHGDKIATNLEKAGKMVSRKTGHKYDRHINKGVGAARERLAKTAAKSAGSAAQPTRPDPPTTGGPRRKPERPL